MQASCRRQAPIRRPCKHAMSTAKKPSHGRSRENSQKLIRGALPQQPVRAPRVQDALGFEGVHFISPGEQTKVTLPGHRFTHNTLVLLGFERAGRVDKPPPSRQRLHCREEKLDLPFMLAVKAREGDAVTNLRVARERSRSAAGCVAKHHVELLVVGQLGGIQNAE